MNVRASLLIAVLILCSAALLAEPAVKCNYASLAACPKIGCSKAGSPLAVTNSQKKTASINGSPAVVTFSDLQELQDRVDEQFADAPIEVNGAKVTSYHNMKAAPRKIILSGLHTDNGDFNEGDYVEVVGFIAKKKLAPHPNTGESVNCKFKDRPSNDYHINITPAKDSEETKGIVVEMIPQNPHRKNEDWSLDKLEALQDKQLKVKVRGRLFFDSEHRPNTSMAKKGGDPRRFSLWEIHPISAFLVCPSGSCTGSAGWKALEDWEP